MRNSELEINISSQDRNDLNDFFTNTTNEMSFSNNVEHFHLYDIFDPAVNEMMSLMADSFSRFLRSETFKSNKRVFEKKKYETRLTV